jgi:hypothetical protein
VISRATLRWHLLTQAIPQPTQAIQSFKPTSTCLRYSTCFVHEPQLILNCPHHPSPAKGRLNTSFTDSQQALCSPVMDWLAHPHGMHCSGKRDIFTIISTHTVVIWYQSTRHVHTVVIWYQSTQTVVKWCLSSASSHSKRILCGMIGAVHLRKH